MSSRFEIGRLSDMLGRPLVLIFVLAQFALAVGFASNYHARQTSDGCLFCHADRERMEKEGYVQFYMTQAQVEKESRMPGAKCIDCHLGDGRSHDKAQAHKGMLKLIVLDNDLNAIPRKDKVPRLIPSGSDRLYALFPKVESNGKQTPDPDVFTILWHDRDPATLGYDPKIAEKTCGKGGCHPGEVEQFSRTDMGGNVRQRSMSYWTDRHGPNNCGPSFADLSPGSGAGFSEANYRLVKDQTSCPSSYGDATDRQRFCNVCHAGCLDCHYNPTAKEGAHSFTRRISAATCTGGGRGTGMCHSGSQERRRGDSYLGAEFSQPPGLPTDVHVEKKMECVDCHEMGEKGMGDMQRRVDCSGCHYSIVKALAASVHKKLRCQACHVSILGGYAMTVWGKGHVVSGRETPFKKYSLYYGITESPILIKDREGFYTPYKVFPNVATNFRGDEKKHDGIDFRWPGGETRDAYAFMGTYPNPGADKALAWLQLEAVGHPLGKSRTCRSCHASTAQKAKARWEYMGFSGSEPFTGKHTLVADENGLRVEGFRNTSRIDLIGDARLCDFAAWKGMGDIWRIGGNFAIPQADRAKYLDYSEKEKAFNSRIKEIEARGGGSSYKRKVKKIAGIGAHDPGLALDEIKKAGF